MGEKLKGRKIAFLATDGVEQVELTEPWKAVEEEGGQPELVSPDSGEIQGFDHLDKGDTFNVDRTTAEADASDYDGLVLPGGVANADLLRMDEHAVHLTRAFFEAGKPVGVICHGPWTMVEADVVRGRTLTSWPSLQTDISNAGGEWWTGKWSRTAGWSPAASLTTFPRSAPRSSRSSARANTASRPPRPSARAPLRGHGPGA